MLLVQIALSIRRESFFNRGTAFGLYYKALMPTEQAPERPKIGSNLTAHPGFPERRHPSMSGDSTLENAEGDRRA